MRCAEQGGDHAGKPADLQEDTPGCLSQDGRAPPLAPCCWRPVPAAPPHYTHTHTYVDTDPPALPCPAGRRRLHLWPHQHQGPRRLLPRHAAGGRHHLCLPACGGAHAAADARPGPLARLLDVPHRAHVRGVGGQWRGAGWGAGGVQQLAGAAAGGSQACLPGLAPAEHAAWRGLWLPRGRSLHGSLLTGPGASKPCPSQRLPCCPGSDRRDGEHQRDDHHHTRPAVRRHG